MAEKIIFTQDQLNLMVQLHDEGMLNKDIAKYFNTSRSTIDRKLAFLGVASRHPWMSQERKEEAIKLYLKYQNLKQVGQELKMSPATVHKILDEESIHVLDMSEVKQICHINEHYFDCIDTVRKSYYLGLLYADGCASNYNHSINISLQEQDKHILESFSRDIESDYKIRLIDYKKKNTNYSNQYSISITNKPFYESLVRLGVKPQKSLLLEFPDFLEECFIPSFLLGYMDGDGTINKKEGRCSFVSTESFCMTVQEIVKKNFDIYASINPCHGNLDVSTRVFRISGRKQAKTFLDWLYNNSDIWLERKYISYQELCNKTASSF